MAITIMGESFEEKKESLLSLLKEVEATLTVENKDNELKDWITTHFYKHASNSDIKMLDFILHSPDLPKFDLHENNDEFFKLSAISDSKIAQYLIFEYGIEKSKSIQEFLEKEESCIKIKIMFENRELNAVLSSELEIKTTTPGKKI